MSAFEGCPGAKMIDRTGDDADGDVAVAEVKSQLRQWPIQMHLIGPTAPYYEGADVVLAADCVAFSFGDFHGSYLKGKSIGIACPKLDDGQDEYVEKIKSWFEDAKINTLTVMIMEVPCCMGLVSLARQAVEQSARKVPVKYIVVGVQGDIQREEWLTT